MGDYNNMNVREKKKERCLVIIVMNLDSYLSLLIDRKFNQLANFQSYIRSMVFYSSVFKFKYTQLSKP